MTRRIDLAAVARAIAEHPAARGRFGVGVNHRRVFWPTEPHPYPETVEVEFEPNSMAYQVEVQPNGTVTCYSVEEQGEEMWVEDELEDGTMGPIFVGYASRVVETIDPVGEPGGQELLEAVVALVRDAPVVDGPTDPKPSRPLPSGFINMLNARWDVGAIDAPKAGEPPITRLRTPADDE